MLPPDSSLLRAAGVVGPLFLLYALVRVGPALLQLRRPGGLGTVKQALWAPHAATIVIGVSFVVSLLAAGRWAYTDVLADLADAMRSRALQPGLPALLLLVLFGGALLGGWTARLWRPTPPTAARLAQCFAGGVLMGWGSLLIPGSNDGLILIGLPLLRPHAGLAVAAMVLAIAAALTLQRQRARRQASA
jgi:toxin CptA